MLHEHALEHGENDLLLRFGQAAQSLQLTLELGRGPALPGRLTGLRAGHTEQYVGGHVEEIRELRHECDGKPEAADLVVSERLLGDPRSRWPRSPRRRRRREAIEDAALVREVVSFYHETLKASPEAIDYLDQRGLNNVELIDRFRFGYANRTLAYRLPGSRWKVGATLRSRLQRLGFIRESGHEHFRGSLVVPIFGERGQLAQAYARKIGRLREGVPTQLYLPGPHTAVWDVDALAASKEVDPV